MYTGVLGEVGFCFHFCFSTVLTWSKVNLHCCHCTPGQLQALGASCRACSYHWEGDGRTAPCTSRATSSPCPWPSREERGVRAAFSPPEPGSSHEQAGPPRWHQWWWARLTVQKTEELWARPLGWEDSPEKGIAAHSSTLAWTVPWTDKPGGLPSIGTPRFGHDWSDSAHRQQGRAFVSLLPSV